MQHKILTFCLVLFFALGGVAIAQLPGTLTGVILDENGDPIPGVRIVATDPESEAFRLEETADKNGRYKLFFTNATIPYNLEFTCEGFQGFTLPGVRIPSRTSTRRNFDMRSIEAAKELLTEAAAAGPDAEAAPADGGYVKIYNTGVMALDGGDINGARSAFEQVLETKPDYGPAFGGMARVYWKQKDWPNAIEYGEKARELDPEDVQIDQVLYAAYEGNGDKKKAKEVLARMQEADPEKAGKNMFNQAADLYNAGDMAGAKPIFEELLATQPKNAKAHYMLGLCYISEGANDQAKQHLTTFLELAPNDKDAPTAKEMLSYLD